MYKENWTRIRTQFFRITCHVFEPLSSIHVTD